MAMLPAATTLLVPAEPDVLGALYALDEALMLQLRPMPDENGEPWTPLPGHLDADTVCGAYDRVLDALRPVADVVYGRADVAPGVPMLVGGGGAMELVQLLAVDVDTEDVVTLGRLSRAVADTITGAGGDLGVLLDDLAADRHAVWWQGEETDHSTVAAWILKALDSVLADAHTADPQKSEDRELLIAAVRGAVAAGTDRIELTAEQEAAYGRYMLGLIRATAPSAADAVLTEWAAGVR
ncbi:hypothetical protein [Kitasatospora griseola]|uniref:hypothetical protein n=1 Tax=Kitasatospora griseola TaxID=2064 RepID=UPI003664E2A0